MERDEKRNQDQTPFFARFLEGQDYPQVKTDLKAGKGGPPDGGGGPPLVTMKWPSDDDEDPILI